MSIVRSCTHGLIYEISNLFSEACEFATTLAACAICHHSVVPARRSRVMIETYSSVDLTKV